MSVALCHILELQQPSTFPSIIHSSVQHISPNDTGPDSRILFRRVQKQARGLFVKDGEPQEVQVISSMFVLFSELEICSKLLCLAHPEQHPL